MQINKKQIKAIKSLQRLLNIDDASYRESLHLQFGVTSCTKLTASQAADVITDLKRIAGAQQRDKYKRPQKVNRNAQLQKIEALLTIGNKSWNYANGMAKRICKVERIEWVPDADLRKIIAALEYQKKREGWN